MKLRIIQTTFVVIAIAASSAVFAHGVGKVRKELTDQGYEDLKFQRTRPPFKLDACKDGTIYHLHVDFYGNIIQKKPLGIAAAVSQQSQMMVPLPRTMQLIKIHGLLIKLVHAPGGIGATTTLNVRTATDHLLSRDSECDPGRFSIPKPLPARW